MTSIAILSPKADPARIAFWRQAWGGMRLPVVREEPCLIIFPDDEKAEPRPGYFVDFHVLGENGRTRFLDVMNRTKNRIRVIEMVNEVGYPVKAEDVTIVRTEDEGVLRMLSEGWE